MRISYDLAKRERAFLERGLDFEEVLEVFRGLTVAVDDLRKDYGERRVLCFGQLRGPLVVVGSPPRGSNRPILRVTHSHSPQKTHPGTTHPPSPPPAQRLKIQLLLWKPQGNLNTR